LTAVLTPDVVLSVIVFTPPVVNPTPLFRVPVAALVVCPMMPGFFVAAVPGVVFWTPTGVGLVPSGFAVFTGVFLTGVAFAGVTLDVGVVEVADETGFFAAATGVFFTGVTLAEGVVAAGVTFFAGVVVVFAGVPTVPFDGVAFAGVVVGVVFAGVPMVPFDGVTFAGVPTFPALLAGVAVFVEFSLAGAFFTGVTAGVVFAVAAGATFLTGVVVF
jgi:hypothetical protein